jgi:hypothetical protein
MSPSDREILENLELLPDDIVISELVAAFLLNCSPRSLRRNAPVPRIQTTERCGGRRLGDIRDFIRRKSRTSPANSANAAA